MSSTEIPSAPAELRTVLLASTQLNSTLDALVNSSLPFEVSYDLASFVFTLRRYRYPASALQELPELLAAITDAVALALSSTAATGQTLPSAKGLLSPTSAETGTAREGETGVVDLEEIEVLRAMIADLRSRFPVLTEGQRAAIGMYIYKGFQFGRTGDVSEALKPYTYQSSPHLTVIGGIDA
jgi:hypothetical protein